jgi:hypothetical protein
MWMAIKCRKSRLWVWHNRCVNHNGLTSEVGDKYTQTITTQKAREEGDSGDGGIMNRYFTKFIKYGENH